MMMKAFHSIDNHGADTTSASGSISLQSTNQLQNEQHYSPAAGAAALTEYSWEHDWSTDDDDEDDDECNCDNKRPSSHPALRYFYPYSTSAAVGGGGRDDWMIPPLLALMAQMVSLVIFTSKSSSSSFSPSLEGTLGPTTASTTSTQQPLFWPMLCFNALVVVVTAWLYYENRKHHQQPKDDNNIAQQQQQQDVLLCIPEILMSLTTLLSWLDFGKMACCTLVLCSLGLSLLVLQALLNQLVGFTSPLPAEAVEAFKRKQQTLSAARRRTRVPRVIQFESKANQ